MAPGIEPESSRLAVLAMSHSALIIANSPQRQLNSTLIPEVPIAGERCVLLCAEQLTRGCYSHCAKTRPYDYGVKFSCHCVLRIAGATLVMLQFRPVHHESLCPISNFGSDMKRYCVGQLWCRLPLSGDQGRTATLAGLTHLRAVMLLWWPVLISDIGNLSFWYRHRFALAHQPAHSPQPAEHCHLTVGYSNLHNAHAVMCSV